MPLSPLTPLSCPLSPRLTSPHSCTYSKQTAAPDVHAKAVIRCADCQVWLCSGCGFNVPPRHGLPFSRRCDTVRVCNDCYGEWLMSQGKRARRLGRIRRRIVSMAALAVGGYIDGIRVIVSRSGQVDKLLITVQATETGFLTPSQRVIHVLAAWMELDHTDTLLISFEEWRAAIAVAVGG
jgi:hypothetical protein